MNFPICMPTRRSFLRSSLVATSAMFAEALGAAIPEADRGVTFLKPEDAGYAEARTIYNAEIKTQPQRIARCLHENGVEAAVRTAIAENWPMAVTAGGHSFEGLSLNDHGLVVEVSSMKEMRLDARTGGLTAAAGCRIGEINYGGAAIGSLAIRSDSRWWLWDVFSKVGINLRPPAGGQDGRWNGIDSGFARRTGVAVGLSGRGEWSFRGGDAVNSANPAGSQKFFIVEISRLPTGCGKGAGVAGGLV